MNIEDFRYISTIARLGRFSSAAQALFISQPALSQRVKYIEKEYGITLFSRSAKGVDLTEDGAIFVKFANEILDSESCLRQHLETRRKIAVEKIRVGTSQLLNTYIFDLLLDTFHLHYPDVKMDIVVDKSGPLQKMLLAGELDLAVIHSINTPYDQLIYEDLCKDQIVVVPASGSHLESKIQALGKQIYEPLPLQMLQNEPFAMTPKHLFLSTTINNALSKQNITLDIQQYSENYDFLYKMAKRGRASVFLIDSHFHPDEDYIPYYYLDSNDLSLQIQICFRKDSPVLDICEKFTQLTKDLNLQNNFF